MLQVNLTNIRCFTDHKPAILKPITLLVGENSSGKSSFLACFRAFYDVWLGSSRNPFNQAPFFLGSYDEIATFKGGRAGRARSFAISLESDLPNRLRRFRRITATRIRFFSRFVRRASQPRLAEIHLTAEPYSMRIEFDPDNRIKSIYLRSPSLQKETEMVHEQERLNLFTRRSPSFDITYILYVLKFSLFDETAKGRSEHAPTLDRDDLACFEELIFALRELLPTRPYAIAPIRSKPERTYSPLDDTPDPEGAHVPFVLTRTYYLSKNTWASLKDSLDRFGKAAGLFHDIDIKRLGRHESDPFQIRVKISGPPRNIIDVGYGVSQSLPIIVDALTAEQVGVFLLQQPEVHLHPRGQAELGSFLCETYSTRRHRFFIETHSDYLIDRVRHEVRQQKNGISPDDVSILYFERREDAVEVHSLKVDRMGNVENAPDSYRQFFMEEERRMLGF